MSCLNVYYALHVQGVSLSELNPWLEQGLSIESLLYRSDNFYMHHGLSKMLATKLSKRPCQQSLDAINRWQSLKHHHVITWQDPHYPKLMQAIHNPPCLLYVKGDVSLLNKPQIAIVGSRDASCYGLQQATIFSQVLGQAGIMVSSGMAMGIDAAAHLGSLNRGFPSLAVLGMDINTVAPRRHTKLYQQLVTEGCVVSEVPFNTPYHSGLFPKRNRLLAGLSLAVLVVEATLKSGALITAYQALNQGKEVFAMPGHVDSPRSFGPHQLIEEGATIALSPEFMVQQLLNLLKTKLV